MANKHHFYTKFGGDKIKLSEKFFASGGEGALYEIASPRKFQHLVAKLYHPDKLSQEREDKMKYLLKHPPVMSQSKENPSAAWVVDLLYQNNKFVGVLMPKIKGKKLTKLCLAKLSKRVSKEWQRFAFGTAEALTLRLKTCFNIAIALHQIHQTGCYVLVDLKPDNILMQPNGLVALVDMDSVEVVENGVAIFAAPVATPEYTPPEHYKQTRTTIASSWDHFSMGVIFYQLLLGLHPFAASAKPPYDILVGLDDKIQHGLYVHHSKRKNVFKVVPPPHKQYDSLPDKVKELFALCFEVGEEQPERRPTAADWCTALAEVLGFNINIPNLLSPNNFVIKPSDYFKSPFDVVDIQALYVYLESLTINDTFDAVAAKMPGIAAPVDEKLVQKVELQLLNSIYQDQLKSAKLQQKKEFARQKAQQKKEVEEFKEESNSTNIGFGPTLLALVILLEVAYATGFWAVLTLIFFLASFIQKMENRYSYNKGKKDVEKEIKLTDIPLKEVSTETVIKAIHNYNLASLVEDNDRLIPQIKEDEALLQQAYKLLNEKEEALAAVDKTSFQKLIDEFEAQYQAYIIAVEDHDAEWINFHKMVKKIQESEVARIKEKVNQLVNHPKFRHHKAKNYLDLRRKVSARKVDAKTGEEIKNSAELDLLEKRYEATIAAERALIKKEYLAVEQKVKDAYAMLWKQKEALEKTYETSKQILSTYENDIHKLDKLQEAYRNLVKDARMRKINQIKLDTTLTWEKYFDPKIAIEQLLKKSKEEQKAVVVKKDKHQ